MYLDRDKCSSDFEEAYYGHAIIACNYSNVRLLQRAGTRNELIPYDLM